MTGADRALFGDLPIAAELFDVTPGHVGKAGR
jgi:hypothetical protein